MQYQVKLVDIAEEFSLEQIYLPENIDEIYVRRSDVSRPGLPLAGYFEYFENGRIQMIGNMEHGYLSSLGAEARFKALDDYLSHDVVAVVVTTSLDIFPELYTLVQKHDTPLYRTTWPTSEFMAALISSLSVSLAERITRHGVLVEVYGEGILMLGDSGIGKSETAIELLKRGHRLVADDAVEIRGVSDSLYGTAPELIRHYIEIRGIGVIDVQQLFGMGSVQFDTELDLVVQLEKWVDGKFYDRLGLGEEMYSILGVKLPYMIIPVRPGRNLAGIVEIATMKNRQMKFGYNPARDFVDRVDRQIDALTRQSEEQK